MNEDPRPVAVITGASAGIGMALVFELLKLNFRVIGIARNFIELQMIHSESTLWPDAAFIPMKCDVSSEQNVRTCIENVVATWGRIDWVIANAGFGVVGNVADLTPEDYRRQFDVNFFGVLHTVQACLPHLRKTKGRIGIMGSMNSYVSLPGNSAYSASKHMLAAFAESLAAELHGDGVSVTFVAPGFVKTRFRRINNKNQMPVAEDRLSEDNVIPKWLLYPVTKAAVRIISAMEGRRRLLILTWHARLVIWLKRLSPWLWAWIIDRFQIKARKEWVDDWQKYF